LCSEKLLAEPVLYLSLYFKANREQYYDLLQHVRETGDWESWLEFFLRGINEMAGQATDTAKKILNLIQKDRAQITNMGRAAGSAMQVHQYLERKPLAVIPEDGASPQFVDSYSDGSIAKLRRSRHRA